MTTLDTLRDAIPDTLKDTRINLGNVLSTEGAAGLSQLQIATIAYACALTSKHPQVIAATLSALQEHAAEDALLYANAATTAAGLMAMNNIYYRFVHLSEHDGVKKMPAKLRMQGLATHGVDKVLFELLCLAVSAMNGCGMCISSHIHELEKHGASLEAIQSSARIAAVIHATAFAVNLS
jgi:lipoyl-dependent peroxiredoxin subunit D